MPDLASRGWDSDFPDFTGASRDTIITSLQQLVRDASEEQVRAWRESIPPLQSEAGEVLADDAQAKGYGAVLEYVLPLDARRPDCVFLIEGSVLVLELKGKAHPTQADIDQASAYARDLRCYHRECAERPVHALLVATQARGYLGERQGVHVCGPDAIDDLVRRLSRPGGGVVNRAAFLDESSYRPLPTLVAAARELMRSGSLRRVHRAAAATEPTVALLKDICVEAARTKTRRLVLLTGVPGAGKTLVGLQTVHAHWLDDLAVSRGCEKPTAPAVFLSGNGPLVEVLQYELSKAGGGGRTFVRGVKEYVKRYSVGESLVPPEHVLVFDEAQRAYDRAMVAEKHKIPLDAARSEPEHFIEFAERIPEWCVVVGLIGGGQEIHKGEEAGLVQWRKAIESSPRMSEWQVHLPPAVQPVFNGSPRPVHADKRLSLDTELRFHLTKDVHRFVAQVLDGCPPSENAKVLAALEQSGYHLRLTRDLDVAKVYLQDRYRDQPDARFGLLASSRDRLLPRFRVYNDFQATKVVRFGPWYADTEGDPSGRSCRLLKDCVTEFGAQGLELDAALVAWGADFRMVSGRWDSSSASRYKRGVAAVRDPHQLRLNSYRVLLTRGREASVIFVPPTGEVDETAEYLRASGVLGL
ncbi:MAG: DUF2075 domain-containing protein [Armatimonadetes bacterium]|nr:DUF2075 domain-containing protein [Armatimonadota bacterium]MBM4052953.1 DUF2075 domain-containing protein [Planctomycetota bacterium]